jgi:hypothetical protein
VNKHCGRVEKVLVNPVKVRLDRPQLLIPHGHKQLQNAIGHRHHHRIRDIHPHGIAWRPKVALDHRGHVKVARKVEEFRGRRQVAVEVVGCDDIEALTEALRTEGACIVDAPEIAKVGSRDERLPQRRPLFDEADHVGGRNAWCTKGREKVVVGGDGNCLQDFETGRLVVILGFGWGFLGDFLLIFGDVGDGQFSGHQLLLQFLVASVAVGLDELEAKGHGRKWDLPCCGI